MAKKHWMDDMAADLRERVRLAVPFVADAIKDEVPFAYKPPKVSDQVDEFLQMDGLGRQQLLQQLGPEEYHRYTSKLMTNMVNRFGPAARQLMPLIEGVEAEDTLGGATVETTDGLFGFAQARADLQELLGVDILGSQ